jgi:Rrf2 family protein
MLNMTKRLRYGLRASVETVMGKNGGYRLVRHPDRISAYDIAQALGEDTMPVPCINHHAPCSRVRKCTTHLLWTRVEALLRDVLIQTSVSQLAFLCIRKGRTSRRRAPLLDL